MIRGFGKSLGGSHAARDLQVGAISQLTVGNCCIAPNTSSGKCRCAYRFNRACSFGLDERLEFLAQVRRMGEHLKLPNLFGSQLPVFRAGVDRSREDSGKKSGLDRQVRRIQTGGFAGGPDGGPIDCGGQILFTRVGQDAVHMRMIAVGPQSSIAADGADQFFEFRSVVNGDQFSSPQRGGCLRPPFDRRWGGFKNEPVGQVAT